MASANPFLCKASGCRFPDTHMTFKHRCGKCREIGHGLLECGRRSKLLNIAAIRTTERSTCLPIVVCQVYGCIDPNTHSTAAHHCPDCNIRHGTENHVCIFHDAIGSVGTPRAVIGCIDQLIHNSILDVVEEDEYSRYAEVRCLDGSVRFVIRSVDRAWRFSDSADMLLSETIQWIRGKVMVFTWDEPDITPPRVASPISFIDYASSDDSGGDILMVCPVCRTDVSGDGGVIHLYGLDINDKCSVCLENPVDNVFVACGHAVICSVCAQHWKN